VKQLLADNEELAAELEEKIRQALMTNPNVADDDL
jgi:hypothetical protein